VIKKKVCLFVADGTRPDSLATLNGIRTRLRETLGDQLPCVILLNKSDLNEDWQITAEEQAAVAADGSPVLLTSAKLGTGVEEAFALLAQQMLKAMEG
jgi:50S ribosomal subunit-associated GTPase HflX